MTKEEVSEKLLSAGLSLYGLFVPILISVIIIGSDPRIGTTLKGYIELSMIYFLPAVFLLTLHLCVCLFVIADWTSRTMLPAYTGLITILYLTLGILGFGLRMIWI